MLMAHSPLLTLSAHFALWITQLACTLPQVRGYLIIHHAGLWGQPYLELSGRFLDLWPPASDPVCQTNLDIMLDTCADLDFNSNPAKTVVPCTTLELLGIVLDSVTQEAHISQNRLDETLNLLRMWQIKVSYTKRQLQSFIGKLNFICSVCRPGRTSIKRLSKGSHLSHHICLTKQLFNAVLSL